MTNWIFKPLPIGLTFRQPTAGEFFATDAVSSPGEALVRESIQNSLDATDVEGGRKARVRIALLSEDSAPSGEPVEKLFQEAWSHFRSNSNGLIPELLPELGDSCKAIVVEDFGARGLEGEPNIAYPPERREQNHFFFFFRAEALTDKDSETKRGSWGLGKDTFLRSSRINTLFGLTIREQDGRRLLMGKTVLKTHKVKGKFHQDGFFGNLDDSGELVMPITDSEFLDQFTDQFQLKRKDESGLSVIVPWPHGEINGSEILEAVLRNYSYCVLRGQLRIEVEADAVKSVADAETLIQLAQDFSKGLEPLQREDFLRPIVLAEWALNGIHEDEHYILKMTPEREAWKWKKGLFPEGVLEAIREKIQERQNIAIRVPVKVRPKGRTSQESFFHVYISVAETDSLQRPICIRNGIVISDSRAVLPRKGIRSLIVIEDQPLAELLRKAENPSHTLWQEKKLKSEYIYGTSCLTFVRRSVKEICTWAMVEDKSKDRRLLADLFPIPKIGSRDSPRPIFKVSSPSKLSVSKTAGGFNVGPGEVSLREGNLVEVSFAYDSRGRDPIKAYSPFDFRIGDGKLECQLEGVECIERTDNQLLIRIVDTEGFRAKVTGFDQNRQIFVKAQLREGNA